jgi:hypothetical protein
MKRGARGRDVAGAKRRDLAGNRDAGPDPDRRAFNAKADRLLRKFQDDARPDVDGDLGPATLKKLGPYFDRYAFFLYEGYMLGTNPVAVKRSKMLAYLVWGYNHRALIYYAQFRPMTADERPVPPSGGGRLLDPVHEGREGRRLARPERVQLQRHREHRDARRPRPPVDLEHAQIGDAVLYSSPQHVAGYVGHGRVIGHGSNAGPSLTDAHYRRDYWQTRDYLT